LHYFRHFGRQLSPYICFIPRLISPGVPSLSIHDWEDRLIESISGWPPKGRDIAIPPHVRQTRRKCQPTAWAFSQHVSSLQRTQVFWNGTSNIHTSSAVFKNEWR
jgi:hypothetical protein